MEGVDTPEIEPNDLDTIMLARQWARLEQEARRRARLRRLSFGLLGRG